MKRFQWILYGKNIIELLYLWMCVGEPTKQPTNIFTTCNGHSLPPLLTKLRNVEIDFIPRIIQLIRFCLLKKPRSQFFCILESCGLLIENFNLMNLRCYHKNLSLWNFFFFIKTSTENVIENDWKILMPFCNRWMGKRKASRPMKRIIFVSFKIFKKKKFTKLYETKFRVQASINDKCKLCCWHVEILNIMNRSWYTNIVLNKIKNFHVYLTYSQN